MENEERPRGTWRKVKYRILEAILNDVRVMRVRREKDEGRSDVSLQS